MQRPKPLCDTVHAVILAGGQARRMGGGDKPLRMLGNRCLLDHVLDRLAPQVDSIAISANGDPARFESWGLTVLADPEPDQGPLSGMLAGLRWAAASGQSWLLTVPGDTPFLPSDLVARLDATRLAAARSIVHAASLGRAHPTVALISVGLQAALQSALASGQRAVLGWMRDHAPGQVDWPEGSQGDPFRNINTPEELAAAQPP